MEELNRRGKDFVNEWCDEKHGTTKRIPNRHYLLEEKAVLLPLPEKHYYTGKLQERKISADGYIHVNGNRYSVPVRYVGKKVFFRILYGFRIMIYDSKGNFIQSREAFDSGGHIRTDAEHYREIAPKTPTSIPQIRRDFTKRFVNGEEYLKAAGRKYDQPTHYARKIMELQELYDDSVLDAFIGIAVREDKLDIRSFRMLLREYNNGTRQLGSPSDSGMNTAKAPSDDHALTRDCSYYEEFAKEGM